MPDSLRTLGFEPLPRFPEERLLVASSIDVRQVRHEAVTMLGQLLRRLVPESPIRPYDCETCTGEIPFDQRVSMQRNLKRPTEPGCAGVICLLGERIGSPLEEEYPASDIPGWENWCDPGRRYRVVHPWPREHEKKRQLELVESGAFPLTGTVCEVLDALGASRTFHIAYFADRSFDDPDVSFNGLSWRKEEQRIKNVKRAAEWLEYDYAIQVLGVTNFLHALRERGRGVPRHETRSEALEGIRHWVETQLVPWRLTEDNPYRSLDFYGIQDGDDFPGRGEETREAVDELKARGLVHSGDPMIVRVTGESGCGKTSFLRAGILAALRHPRERGQFRVVAVRPTDFHDEHGRPGLNLPLRLLELVTPEIADLELPPKAYGRVAGAGPGAARSAVEALVQALETGCEDAPTVVIGLDQFEEIVDDLGARDQRAYAADWLPLLSFVELAMHTGRIGFVYTLENSRRKLFDQVPLPAVFREAHEVPLGGASDRFLTAVITRPFQKAGYRLSEQTVNTLLASYQSYSERTGGHASLLPLLSLKLFNLFETVRSLRGVRPRTPSGDGPSAQFDPRGTEVPHDEVKNDLQFDNEIAELADRAWGARDEPEEVQLDDLNLFLTPLVRLSGEELDQITLRTVGEMLFVNLEERLAAFQNARLVIRESGRRRLVHEAVVRQWPLAARWLARKREYLEDEAQYRRNANAWIRDGALPGDQASIDTAVSVLHGNLLEWPHMDEAALSGSDLKLKKYCEAIFRQSETPERRDSQQARRGYAHVHVAAAYGLTDLLEKFVRLCPDCLAIRSGRGSTAIEQAAWTSATVTRFVLEKGAQVNVDDDGWPTLSCAVWRKEPEIFRVLLPYYRTPESIATPEGTNLLHIAAGRGAVEMVVMLLGTIQGLKPMPRDDRGRTPLEFAAMSDRPEAFGFFQEHWAADNRAEGGWTVLHYAAYFGASRVVDEILSRTRFHVIVNVTDHTGRTALMIAAEQRHDAVVRKLAAAMDPNAQVPDDAVKAGWTALHFAVAGPQDGKPETRASRQQALRTVRALLEAPDIDPNRAAADGRVPLALAGSLPYVIRAFIDHPSFVPEKRLPDGSTPLNRVIQSQNRLAVERMLRLPELDVELVDADGSYAPNLLIRNEMTDLALELFTAGRVNPWNVAGTDDIGLVAAISARHAPLVEAYLQTLPATCESRHRRQLSLALRAVLMNGVADALMERLLALGASPEARLNRSGWTLFHYAALVGNVAAFDRFALASPDTSRRDDWGRRPVDLAPDHLRDQFAIRMKELSGEGPTAPGVLGGGAAP